MLRRFCGVRAEVGQTTAKYALVILGAAAIGALLIVLGDEEPCHRQALRRGRRGGAP